MFLQIELAILGSCERLLPPLPFLLGDGQEQLELRRKLLLRVQAVGKVNPADAAVRVDLHPQGLDVVGTVRSAREIAKVKLDLVPSLLDRFFSGQRFVFKRAGE